MCTCSSRVYLTAEQRAQLLIGDVVERHPRPVLALTCRDSAVPTPDEGRARSRRSEHHIAVTADAGRCGQGGVINVSGDGSGVHACFLTQRCCVTTVTLLRYQCARLRSC